MIYDVSRAHVHATATSAALCDQDRNSPEIDQHVWAAHKVDLWNTRSSHELASRGDKDEVAGGDSNKEHVSLRALAPNS